MKKIFVGGAGGFIGGHLVRHLLDSGLEVVAVDIKPLHEWFQVCEEAANHVGNLERLEVCVELTQGCDVIYNLACNMGGMGFIENNRALCMLSVLINTHLLMAAKENGIKRYFYASSACIYPNYRQSDIAVTALKEEDAFPAMPEAGYGWEKLFSEQMCKYFREDFGMEIRMFRFHNVYGPNGSWTGGREKAPAAICRKIIEAKQSGKHEIDVWGDGNQTRSFMYIDDCIEGIELLMNSNHTEPLNLGRSELVSINQLIDIVENIAGIKVKRNHQLDAPQGVRGRNSDNTRIQEVLGWEPGIDLQTGMKKTYDWIYSQMHSNVSQKKSPQKVIIWNPDEYDFGLGDRLRGIAGGCLYAKNLQAKLIIGAPKSEACPEDFEALFEAGDDFIVLPEYIEVEKYKHSASYEVIAIWNHRINFGPTAHYNFLKMKDHLSLRKFWSQWAEILNSLKPKQPIEAAIENIVARMNPRVLGVHLRRTDVMSCNSKSITQDNLEEYDGLLWEEILRLIDEKGYKQVFLASDEKHYFREWKRRLLDIGIEVIHYEQNWSEGFRQTPLDGVVIDMYMMAQCDEVVGSVPSSLFLVGRALGGKYRIVEPVNIARERKGRAPLFTFLEELYREKPKKF